MTGILTTVLIAAVVILGLWLALAYEQITHLARRLDTAEAVVDVRTGQRDQALRQVDALVQSQARPNVIQFPIGGAS